MSHCPKKPPSTWKEVIKEMVNQVKEDKETKYTIIFIIAFLLAIGIIIFSGH